MNELVRTSSGSPASIPLLNFRTGDLPDAEALAHWRGVMAPLFNIGQARYTTAVPRGDVSVFLVGEIMVNRCTFNGQHFWRDPALIAATPDHLVLQYYRSGGFRGMIAGQPACIVRGQVAIADLSQEIDAYAATSDTIGLSVPRSLLGGIDAVALRRQLDAPRNRLLGGYMADLPKRLGRMHESDIPAVTTEIIALLRRVFGPAPVGAGAATEYENLLDHALESVEPLLGKPDLSPAVLAERIGISRATLYRLFGPMGGVMRYVQERRLLSVRDALSDALDRRTLAQLAVAHGFTSQALLSRGFRSRFGVSPRDWRHAQVKVDRATREPSHDTGHILWQDLGRHARRA